MLSYRHSFHAGNFADVIKHLVLIEILAYFTRKETPFEYYDTHAGAGLYDLGSKQADKLQEYHDGIGRLRTLDWPELKAYRNIVDACNKSAGLKHYPGSPLIAQHWLREYDKAWLFELHPNDVQLLNRNAQDDKRIKIYQQDGYQGLIARLPPRSRRGLVLLDPPYEMKTDYRQVFETVQRAYKKFATGSYAVWYPVVERKRINWLLNQFQDSGIRNIQRFELGICADTGGRGMTAAGMIVVNPPWTLLDHMASLLPRLSTVLAQGDGAFFKCEALVAE